MPLVEILNANLRITALKAIYTPESVTGCLQDPTQNASCVVTVTQYVITRRKTMLGAIYLHLIELLHVKLVSSHHAPVMSRGIHWEAGSERTVSANDQ